MMWWRAPVAVVIGIGAFVGLIILGCLIFDMIALPDICDYHNKDVETSWLFDLFFPTGGAGGGHPAPGLVFNLTALAGGIGAGILAFRLMKKVLTRNGVKADAQEIR